ncbi:hypothetical protein EDB84DRAFT_1531754 [Lactarius hengduanensis]|nr:hypothetical protein EDB84DRAFT_1531754 [Lactarius hengduanensis]
MQGTALRRTSVISAGAAFGRYGVRPAIPTLLHQRQHIHTRTTPRNVPSSQTTRRAIASSTASLSTVPTSEATRRSSDDDVIYVGPLTQTFRRLKIFSLSSLALAGSLSPFIFIVESSLPSTARVALAATALATSGVSTALVAWCGKPYVTTLRRLSSAAPTAPQQQHTTHSHNENAPAGIELTTLTLALTPRATRVYDPAFLSDATRAFARWELARSVQLPPEDAAAVRPGEEETVAETLDSAGKVIGRWIVTWGENGEGSVHFNVHEELLATPVR